VKITPPAATPPTTTAKAKPKPTAKKKAPPLQEGPEVDEEEALPEEVAPSRADSSSTMPPSARK